MLIYWIWFSRLKLSIRQKLNLLQLFHDPESIYKASAESLEALQALSAEDLEQLNDRALAPSRQILRQCSEKSISILTYGDSAYPRRLQNIQEPPLVLYYKGCLPDWESVPVIGIVGTRKSSSYGIQTARKLGTEIAQCGGLVVSGGADGIDTAALEGALSSGCNVVAVLGCGADMVYPAKNKALFQQIQQHGCLLSEFLPGTPAYSWNFLQRNRIISGLSAGILVVEAPERSGALNTARHAREQGRDLFVVPGNIDSQTCAGSNKLLQEQAIPVFSGWDILREYECLYPHSVRRVQPREPAILTVAQPTEHPVVTAAPTARPDKKSIDNPEKSHYSVGDNKNIELSPEEQAVVKLLTPQPRPVDEVIAEAMLPAAKVLSVLTMLALKGLAVNHPGKRISLK